MEGFSKGKDSVIWDDTAAMVCRSWIVGYRLYIPVTIIISTALSLAKKLKIIEPVEKGDKSRRDVAKEFSVAKSTVSLLCCKKNTIRKAVESTIID